KSAEVDADLNEIYTNITNINIASGAAIAYTKLALTNKIVSGDLTAGSVLTAAIADSSSPSTGVTGPKIAAGAVPVAKLAATATIRTVVPPTAVTHNLNIFNTETPIATAPSTTLVGGYVLVICPIAATVQYAATVLTNKAVTLKLWGGAAGT